MGTTSEKLTYLNTTKQKLKQAINNLGGDITSETTFRNYANELETLYSNLPKVSGEGSSITLSPTLKGKLNYENNIVGYGDTSQSTTTGKNLFNLGTGTYTKPAGITGTYNNAIIKINGTTTASTNVVDPNVKSIGTFSAGTYRFSTTILGGTLTLNGGATAIYIRNANSASSGESIVSQGGFNVNINNSFTLTEATELWVQIYCNASNVVYNNYEVGIQIESGSTKTDFEQYTGRNC